jgi:hypothetical protein
LSGTIFYDPFAGTTALSAIKTFTIYWLVLDPVRLVVPVQYFRARFGAGDRQRRQRHRLSLSGHWFVIFCARAGSTHTARRQH